MVIFGSTWAILKEWPAVKEKHSAGSLKDNAAAEILWLLWQLQEASHYLKTSLSSLGTQYSSSPGSCDVWQTPLAKHCL